MREQPHATAAASAAVLLCWGARFMDVTLGGDDWRFLFPNADGMSEANLQLGRWGAHLIHEFIGGASFAPFFTTFAALAALVLMGVVFAATAGLNGPATFVLIALNGTSPLYSEYVSFELLHLPEGFGLVAATVGASILFRDPRSWRAVLSAAITVMLALSVYQSTVVTFAVAWLSLIAYDSLQRLPSSRWLLTHLRGLVVAAGLGLVSYAISVRVSQAVAGIDVGGGRYSLTGGYLDSPEAVLDSARRTATLSRNLFFRTTAMMPSLLKAVAVLLVLLAFISWHRRLRRLGGGTVVSLLVPGVTTALLLGGPLVFWFVRLVPVDRYNVVTPLALSFAVLVSLLVTCHAERVADEQEHRNRASTVVMVLVVVVIATSGFQISRAFTGHHLANERDLAVANRILWAIESHPAYDQLEGSVPVGIEGAFDPFFRGRPFRYQTGLRPDSIVGCGFIPCQIVRAHNALNLVNAAPLRYQRGNAQALAEEAEIDLADLPRWPAQGSVVVTDSGVIIRAS